MLVNPIPTMTTSIGLDVVVVRVRGIMPPMVETSDRSAGGRSWSNCDAVGGCSRGGCALCSPPPFRCHTNATLWGRRRALQQLGHDFMSIIPCLLTSLTQCAHFSSYVRLLLNLLSVSECL